MWGTLKQLLVFAALLLCGFAFNPKLLVHAQDQSGFISIDCGLPAENSSYIESTTGINYTSDANLIDTGEIKLVLPEYRDKKQRQYQSLRSFPEGKRNCYNINVTSRTRYLIRSWFFYGNYDGQDKSPEFELHFGVNLWDSVTIDDASTEVNKELIHFVPDGSSKVQVCLANIGSGVPFISALELRPLINASYEAPVGSLALEWRYDIGLMVNKNGYRYPEDIHDRLWYFYESPDDWELLNTSSPNATIDAANQNSFNLPSVVMRTAVKPKNENETLNFVWNPTDFNAKYYYFMHFAEVENLRPSLVRFQYIARNGQIASTPFWLEYMWPTSLSMMNIMTVNGVQKFSIIKTDNSTGGNFPPILNAFEMYKVKRFVEAETIQADVSAVTQLKSANKIRRNWQGDPCAPQIYSWEGLNCSYSKSDQALRIISLNLSSSGLTGEIDISISTLTMIETLDLSNNNFSGPVPEFLSQLPNLKVLKLDNNSLTGLVPAGLIERMNEGSLSFSLCNNQLNVSGDVGCVKMEKGKTKQNILIPIVIGVSVLLFTIIAILWGLNYRKKRRDAKSAIRLGMGLNKRQFTHPEILKFTNNLERTLGRGGFGTVYHGNVDNTQVAIKMLSSSSVQGLHEFQAEVKLLMRVHHTNLTSLVGYCNEESNMALVYEYMANGNLQEHLSDGSSTFLSWEDRLRIALDAAQGLEYLHYGCKPPIIHRDVKSANILLTENFQAKVGDFGLSKNFNTDLVTHLTTGVAGTPGYLDPEYYLTSRLNEKSDVYSFGIVLLEIITGRPVISGTVERIHISQWVTSMLRQGDIYSIVDPILERNLDANCAWKFVETATTCISPDPVKRPMMSQVVMELKECLAIELARTKQKGTETETDLGGYSTEISSQNDSIQVQPSVVINLPR